MQSKRIYNKDDIFPKTCTVKICDESGNVIKEVKLKKGEKLPKLPNHNCYYEID